LSQLLLLGDPSLELSRSLLAGKRGGFRVRKRTILAGERGGILSDGALHKRARTRRRRRARRGAEEEMKKFPKSKLEGPPLTSHKTFYHVLHVLDAEQEA